MLRSLVGSEMCIRDSSDSLDKHLPEDFQLEVSSPGIDTPLKYPFQYKKNVGRQIKIRKNLKTNSIIIKLNQVSENGISGVNKKGEEIKFKFKDIESATIITVF